MNRKYYGYVVVALAIVGCSQVSKLSGSASINSASPGSSGIPGPTITPTPQPSGTPTSSPTTTPTAAPTSPPGNTSVVGLHVAPGSGGSPGHLVNGAGQIVQLHGADHSYTEDACVNGGGFSDGHLTQADINIMKTWKINAVRVPMNEACWLGITGSPSGSAYQSAMKTYVNLLTSNGLVVIVDLHWLSDEGQNDGQQPFPDADHTPQFWTQVATMFASKGASDTSQNSMIIFDLFNEPYLPGTSATADWNCWVKGGASCTSNLGISYTPTGMAVLLKAVRDTGAQNVVMMGGFGYSSDFSQWVASVQSIPSVNGTSIANVAASWHEYTNNANFNNYQYSCPNEWNNYSGTCPTTQQSVQQSNINAVLAAGFTVIIGETEVSYESNQVSSSVFNQLTTWWDSLLTWMDSQQQGYMAWSWNTNTPPALILDFSGNPTESGKVYKNHLSKF